VDEGLQAEISVMPQDLLKIITKILRAKMVPDKTTKTVKLYSKSGYGAFVSGEFKAEHGVVNIVLRSTIAELTDALMSEIEVNLKTL
jgi:hypothetical protein